MSNSIDPYIHVRYANETLQALENALGMARYVRRDLDLSSGEHGQVTQVEKPSVFAATAMPVSATDLDTSKVDITLDQWYGVAFKVRDDELTFASPRLVEDHLRPAAYAVAKQIDTSINQEYKNIPWQVAATATPTNVNDFTAVERILFDNGVPAEDRYLELCGERREKYMNVSTFHQANTNADGGQVQRAAELGEKFTLNIFGNQNVQSHTKGTLTIGTAAQINATVAAGLSAIVVKDSGGSLSGTVTAGDTFTIDGHTQSYTITAAATAASNLISLSLFPALEAEATEDDAVTFTQDSGSQNLAFHKNAFVLKMAKLPLIGAQQGGRVFTVADPKTGLSLRLSFWTDFANAQNYARVDAIWGVKTLYENAAVRLVGS